MEIPLLGRSHERAQSLKAVGRDESAGDQVPEASLDVRGQAAGAGDDVVVEEGALRFEQIEDVGARTGPGDLRESAVADASEEPGEIDAAGEGYRGGGVGYGALRSVLAGLALAGGEACPGDVAGEAEFIEPGAFVSGDTGGKDVTLPGDGGDVKALELGDGL